MAKKYTVISIVSILMILIGVSVAYFTLEIVGKGKNMGVRAKELSIVFTDSATILEDNIGPGWSTSKTFTVENRSAI